jgi:hypothetical protein
MLSSISVFKKKSDKGSDYVERFFFGDKPVCQFSLAAGSRQISTTGDEKIEVVMFSKSENWVPKIVIVQSKDGAYFEYYSLKDDGFYHPYEEEDLAKIRAKWQSGEDSARLRVEPKGRAEPSRSRAEGVKP